MRSACVAVAGMTPRFISVTATLPSRRRSGFQFGKEPVVLDLEQVGEDVLTFLLQDPCLVIKELSEVQVAEIRVATMKAAMADASQIPVDNCTAGQIIPTSMPLNIRDIDQSEGSIFVGDGVYARYGDQILSLPLSGDPVADWETFFDEVALFAEKTGLTEAAQRSQPQDDVGADLADEEKRASDTGDKPDAADLADNQEKASAKTDTAAPTAKSAKTDTAAPTTKSVKAKGGGEKL